MITQTIKESKTETPDPEPSPRPKPDPGRATEPIEIHETTYLRNHVAAFMRSGEKYGDLSNMTFGYSLTVNELVFQGPEGLYQAFKFPNEPGFQQLIGVQRSGMDAKKTAYTKSNIRPDWDEVKADAMRFALATKLMQHPKKFREALAQTGTWPIVEMSFRDEYWGAKPKRSNTVLVGINLLGKLMTQLRDELKTSHGDVPETVMAFTRNIPPGSLIVNRCPANNRTN